MSPSPKIDFYKIFYLTCIDKPDGLGLEMLTGLLHTAEPLVMDKQGQPPMFSPGREMLQTKMYCNTDIVGEYRAAKCEANLILNKYTPFV